MFVAISRSGRCVRVPIESVGPGSSPGRHPLQNMLRVTRAAGFLDVAGAGACCFGCARTSGTSSDSGKACSDMTFAIALAKNTEQIRTVSGDTSRQSHRYERTSHSTSILVPSRANVFVRTWQHLACLQCNSDKTTRARVPISHSLLKVHGSLEVGGARSGPQRGCLCDRSSTQEVNQVLVERLHPIG